MVQNSFLLPALLRGGGEGYNRVVFSAATFNPVSCIYQCQFGPYTFTHSYFMVFSFLFNQSMSSLIPDGSFNNSRSLHSYYSTSLCKTSLLALDQEDQIHGGFMVQNSFLFN